jgi:hypothetical protein
MPLGWIDEYSIIGQDPWWHVGYLQSKLEGTHFNDQRQWHTLVDYFGDRNIVYRSAHRYCTMIPPALPLACTTCNSSFSIHLTNLWVILLAIGSPNVTIFSSTPAMASWNLALLFSSSLLLPPLTNQSSLSGPPLSQALTPHITSLDPSNFSLVHLPPLPHYCCHSLGQSLLILPSMWYVIYHTSSSLLCHSVLLAPPPCRFAWHPLVL